VYKKELEVCYQTISQLRKKIRSMDEQIEQLYKYNDFQSFLFKIRFYFSRKSSNNRVNQHDHRVK